MTTIDLFIFILLLWGAIMGFIKGFVIQSLTLVALVLGVWGGMHFSYIITDYLGTHYAMKGKMVTVISFTIIFIAVLIVMHYLGKLLTSVIHESVLGVFNRLAGIAFGIFKMAFIISIFIAVIGKLDMKHRMVSPADAQKSIFYKPVQKLAPAIFPYFHFEELKNGILNG